MFLIMLIVIPIATAINPPTNLNSVNITNSMFTADWVGIINGSSYNVQLSKNPLFLTIDQSNITTATNLKFIGLKSATTYYWRVNASNSIDSSIYVNESVGTLTNAGDTGLFTGGLLSMNFEKRENIVFFIIFILLSIPFLYFGMPIFGSLILLIGGTILLFSGINFLIGVMFMILGVMLMVQSYEL